MQWSKQLFLHWWQNGATVYDSQYALFLWHEKRKHISISTYGTVIPSWRKRFAGELEAIQMQWSKQVYISWNNIKPANTCSISQQPAWLWPTALPSLGIFKFSLGICSTHKYLWGGYAFFIYLFCPVALFCLQWTPYSDGNCNTVTCTINNESGSLKPC